MSTLGALYGRVARARRAWFAKRPHASRRLPLPVISVGNLSVGGSGKTPAVAGIARMLVAAGERPAILSRGYGRTSPDEGVVVVSDGRHVLEPVERSGDEPQMLARTLPGVSVFVCSDRHLAGLLAERRFGATVAILDDGFQHLQLTRDVNLLLVQPSDLTDGLLPSGRLREPLTAATAADSLIVAGTAEDATQAESTLGVSRSFLLTRRFGSARLVAPFGEEVLDAGWASGRRVVALAGIARPERFFETLETLGWHVTRPLTYADHHWYSAKDVAAVQEAVRATAAEGVVTTEKDAVRLTAMKLPPETTWMYLPMRAAIEPQPEFYAWLGTRLVRARVALGAGDR